MVPTMFRHAARFRPGFVGAWLFWVLGAAILLLVPLLLVRALMRSVDEDGPESGVRPLPSEAP
jgi:hypothetical protein